MSGEGEHLASGFFEVSGAHAAAILFLFSDEAQDALNPSDTPVSETTDILKRSKEILEKKAKEAIETTHSILL
jgi:hypothetical protein